MITTIIKKVIHCWPKVNYDNGQQSLWLAELHSLSLSLPEPFAIHVFQEVYDDAEVSLKIPFGELRKYKV
jgi:hypothetical protein